jgi:RNase P subunit RPR2
MIVPKELQFARIALKDGKISKEQLNIVIKTQKDGSYYESVGRIMVRLGYLTKQDIERLLNKQMAEFENAISTATTRETLFGAIAVMKRYVTLTQVEECLKEQHRLRRLGLYMRLGEILISKNYMSMEQLLDVLQQQKTNIKECPSCGRTYNVTTFTHTKEQFCPACNTPLQDVKEVRSPKVDGGL